MERGYSPKVCEKKTYDSMAGSPVQAGDRKAAGPSSSPDAAPRPLVASPLDSPTLPTSTGQDDAADEGDALGPEPKPSAPRRSMRLSRPRWVWSRISFNYSRSIRTCARSPTWSWPRPTNARIARAITPCSPVKTVGLTTRSSHRPQGRNGHDLRTEGTGRGPVRRRSHKERDRQRRGRRRHRRATPAYRGPDITFTVAAANLVQPIGKNLGAELEL